MRILRAANTVLRSNAVASTSLRATPSLIIPSSRPAAGCRSTTASAPWQHSSLSPGSRPFSQTATCQKRKGGGGGGGGNNSNNKNGRNGKNNNVADADRHGSAPAANSGASAAAEAEIDPFDFSDLQQAFDRAEQRFTEELKKLRSTGGGRFSAEAVGAVAVQVDRKSGRTFPLRELATVAPAGPRRLTILAFDEASVKPIMSAVQRSDAFNQQPQRSEANPLELTMTVEPERADVLARRARDVCQAWRARVRDEAHRRAEQHKRWRAAGALLSDAAHKLKEKLQKLQDDRMKVITTKEKEVVAAIMARAGG